MGNNVRKSAGLARCASVTLAAVLVACADGITGPPESPGPAVQATVNLDVVEPSKSQKPKVPKAAIPDIVIMERTTDIGASNGRAATRSKLTRKLVGQTRLGNGDSFEGKGKVHTFDAEDLPRPPISLPARYQKSLCAATPGWKGQLRGATTTSADVEMSGFGDAPPSTLQFALDGNSFTIERTWVRTPHTWQLERQVTTSSDGKYRDVVTYHHVTASGHSVNNAIPVTNCASSSVGPVLSDYSNFPDGTSNLQSDDCSSFDYGSDACFDKQSEVYKADGALVVAGTALTIACRLASPIVVTTCLAASTVYGAAVLNLFLAQRALNECIREQRAKACGCGTGVVMGTSSGASVSLPGANSQGNFITATEGPSGSSFDDCGYDALPPYSGGGGEGSGGNCSWQVWEISYDDGVTWEYLGTFWTCYSVT